MTQVVYASIGSRISGQGATNKVNDGDDNWGYYLGYRG